MTSYRLTEQFLAQCYQAKFPGDAERAADVAAWFIAVSTHAGISTVALLEARERDAHVLHLAGQAIPRATIALRVGLSRVAVYDAIKRQQKARRAALRLAGRDSPPPPLHP